MAQADHLSSNAKRLVIAQSATKIGDIFTDAKTVLTWLLTALGAPAALIAMLVPIRESGSMLPQLFISGWVQRARIRKWVYVAGAVAQALCVAAMGLSALFFTPTTAALAVLVSLACFSVARSFCSISSKDVLGRTVAKGSRGKLNGISSTVSGILSTLAAFAYMYLRKDAGPSLLAMIVIAASFLWLIGAALYASIAEQAPEDDEEDASQNISDLKQRLRIVIDDPMQRRFIIVRTLLLGSALASPLLVILSHQHSASPSSLAAFVIASGLASSLSSSLWGKLSDHASHLALRYGGLIAGGIGFLAILISSTDTLNHTWTWPLLFFLLNLGYAGVRLGRKTWIVDSAEGNQRTDYVAVSNTVIALAIILIGSLSALLSNLSTYAPLTLYSACCLIGAFLCEKLKLDSEYSTETSSKDS